MSRRRIFASTIVTACALLIGLVVTGTWAAPNAKLHSSVAGGGGNSSTSTSFKLGATVGQSSAIGNSSSTNYGLSAGFWYVANSSLDTDGDGCPDLKEPLLVPATNLSNPWDFFSVPVPALFAATNPLVVFKDKVVTAADAQSVFGYFKAGAHTGTTVYEQDLNQNGVKDGVEYDRSVAGPGMSGPPAGTVTASAAQVAFAQFKRAYHC